MSASQPGWPKHYKDAASEGAGEQPGEAGWLAHEAGRVWTGWPSAGLTLNTSPLRHLRRGKLTMQLWVPHALLALLLPTFLTQGEGKGAVCRT